MAEVHLKRRIGVTHQNFDSDAASCLRFLEKTGEISEVIFTGDLNAERIIRLVSDPQVEKVVFIDAAPTVDLTNATAVVEIYDNHQEKYREEEVSSFDLVLRGKSSGTLNRERLEAWQGLVWHGERRPDSDPMDMHKAVKRIHRIMDDKEAYGEWFVPMFDAVLEGEYDAVRGVEICREALLQFALSHSQSPAKGIIERWTERVGRPESLLRGSPRNMARFLGYMDKESGRKWMGLTLEALEDAQRSFEADKDKVGEVHLKPVGTTTFIASMVTSSTSAVQAARSVVKSDDAPDEIKERRGKPWVIVQVTPETDTFQIFAQGSMKAVQDICDELVKAIRAELLREQHLPVPDNEETLRSPGTLEGTDPLYFHSYKGKGYSNVLWGSPKRKVRPAHWFGDNAEEIRRRLVDIADQVLDESYFFEPLCDDCPSLDCPMYSWYLEKCVNRRRKGGTTNR